MSGVPGMGRVIILRRASTSGWTTGGFAGVFGVVAGPAHAMKVMLKAVLLQLDMLLAGTPLCPAGHLPHKGQGNRV
jgi:hypothetical protein